MFIVLLKFSNNKHLAKEFMLGHKDWIKKGFDDDAFLMVGSLKPATETEKGGGAIIAHNTSLQALQQRVNQDPFVVENVVSAKIIEIAPNQAHERLNFLLDLAA